MSRYVYSHLIKMIFTWLLMMVFVPSVVYLICSSLINKSMSIVSLLFAISCVVLWGVVNAVLPIINRVARNRIVFEAGKLCYRDKIEYAEGVSIKYFKFYISVLEPILVVPKVHINGERFSVTCYLSRKDIKKLKALKYNIQTI